MRYSLFVSVVFVLILLVHVAKSKGRGGGGGGFKLSSFKKAPSRTAKAKPQKTATARATDNDAKYSNRDIQKEYGTLFAKGLSKNSYIYNNNYRTQYKGSGIAQFLTKALFFRASLKLSHEMNQYDEWNEEDDSRWRSTTQAPYFENRIPGKFCDK